jgi:hypothetical protein
MNKSQLKSESQEKWKTFLDRIDSEISRLRRKECVTPFFRGHNDSTWKLIPLIYRLYIYESLNETISFGEVYEIENSLKTDFLSRCDQLYNRKLDPWETVFEMRHAGLPTRLLDWTENFATALYFALNDRSQSETTQKPKNKCIWILNPNELNEKSFGESSVLSTSFLNLSYNQSFSDIEDDEQIEGPIAILPHRSHQRIVAQQSVYTYHFDETPIEKFYRPCVKKIIIPNECWEQAELFLSLAGVNDFSLFPDLDGLGAYLRKKYRIYTNEDEFWKYE